MEFEASDPLGPGVRDRWMLDPEVAFLNHGSFGACPVAVLERQAELRRQMERQPCRFFLREVWDLLDEARSRIASFLGAAPEDLVAVPNATSAVNAVARSLSLAPGDEVLVTDHGYAACRHVLAHVAAEAGASLRVAEIPFPLPSGESAAVDVVTDAVLGAATEATRFALLDHVTSPTGLVLPLERLVPPLVDRGIAVMIDGAHAPGQLDLDLARMSDLGVEWYAGNLHKWPCAPKGAGFLHVAPGRQERLVPATISHGQVSRRRGRSHFHDRFDWPGTADPTPFLAAPAALELLGGLHPEGWPGLRRRNRDLGRWTQQRLAEALGVERPAPAEMVAAMAAVPLPDRDELGPAPWAMATGALQDALLERHSVEVPIQPWPRAPRRLVRVSCPAYIGRDDVERGVTALLEELDRERQEPAPRPDPA